MVSADRCLKILEIPQENFVSSEEMENSLSNRLFWPEEGNVKFDNVVLKYRPNTENVLKNLSFEIGPG